MVWAPVAEEFTFRLGLVASPYRLGFAAAFMLLILFDTCCGGRDSFIYSLPVLEDLNPWALIGVLVLGLFLAGIILSQALKPARIFEPVQKFFADHFGWIFYGSALFFGLVHVVNYYNYGDFWYIIPFLVAPQVIIGVLLGFFRMYYGLGSAMLAHFVHNLILSVPVVLLYFLSEDLRLYLEGEAGQIPENLAMADNLVLVLFGFSFIVFSALFILAWVSLAKDISRYQRSG